MDGSLYYTTLKLFPTLSLSLSFSLPRFSCVTLSGASSHFALVASHSVSLPNIVGVVFCTRIRIRSTMKLTKGLYTRRKEGRKEEKRKESRKSSSSFSSLFLSVLFFCVFLEEERQALTVKTKKKKEKKEAREIYLFFGHRTTIFVHFHRTFFWRERERVRGVKVQIKNCFLASISLSLSPFVVVFSLSDIYAHTHREKEKEREDSEII